MTRAMRKIIISTIQGPKSVDAYVHGKFACNPIYLETDDLTKALYVITHVASGLDLLHVGTRPAARTVARQLDTAVEHDITIEDIATKSAAWATFTAIVKPIIKKEDSHDRQE